MSASAHARQQRHGTAGPNPNENPGEGNSGGPSDPSDQLSNHRRPGDQDDESTGTVIDAAELAAFREYQANKAHRRNASLSYESQGSQKKEKPSLKSKDPEPYKGIDIEELDNFIDERERQFTSKGFERDNLVGTGTLAQQQDRKEQAMKKVAYAEGFLEDRARTDFKSWKLQFPAGPRSWTHFSELLQEFLEGDKDEAWSEGNQKLATAKQRRSDTINIFYDYTYKLHIRLRALDQGRSMTDQHFFDYFRARVLPEYRTKLDELMVGPKTMQELLAQLHKYERSNKSQQQREVNQDKPHAERSSKSQDQKKDTKSRRKGATDQKSKDRDRATGQGKKDKDTEEFVMYKDKLKDDVRERRYKDGACYKCGMCGHRTRDCTIKEQVLFDSPKMLESAKNK